MSNETPKPAVKGKDLPLLDVPPGEDCPECGRRIPEGKLLCHTCRVQPHTALVDRICAMIRHASSDRRVQNSIATAVKSELFVEPGQDHQDSRPGSHPNIPLPKCYGTELYRDNRPDIDP